jgi:hypothetical protein
MLNKEKVLKPVVTSSFKNGIADVAQAFVGPPAALHSSNKASTKLAFLHTAGTLQLTSLLCCVLSSCLLMLLLPTAGTLEDTRSQ